MSGISNETAGPLDNSIGASANFNNVWVQELYFEVFRPTTLKSVLLYPSGSGVIEVELRDTSGTVLQSKLISVSNTSGERVNLDFQLPIGTYEIGGGTNSTVGLQRNSAGASYPYTSSNGSVSITGNSFGTSYYYYFYDWELGGGCESEAVMAIATIDCLVSLEDDLTAVNSFEIYPNPSSGLFTMSFTTVKAEQLNLSVRDVAGKLILSRDIHVNGSYRDDIDLSHLSKGIYYLHLQNESGVKVEKLIIQ